MIRDIYTQWQYALAAVCMLAPLAIVAAIGVRRAVRAMRRAGLRRAIVALLFAAPAIYLGATKGGGHVIVDDPYIQDDGSYLTNDVAHVAIAKRSELLPDDTEILVYARELSSTNAADWSRLSPHLTYADHPYDYSLPNATNYNVTVAASYTPAPTVHTNGVWQLRGFEVPDWSGAFAFGNARAKTIEDNPYITDGLVAMWDGEWNAGMGVHDASATKLFDLVSSSEDGVASTFTANAKNMEVTVSSGGNGSNHKFAKAFKTAIDGGYAHLEVVAFINAPAQHIYGNYISFLGGSFGYNPTTGNGGVSMFGSGWITSRDTSVVGSDCARLVLDIDAANATIKYQVGDGDAATGTITIPSSLTIAGIVRGDGTRMYSARCYSRALTADEIAANYEIDRVRFNLP